MKKQFLDTKETAEFLSISIDQVYKLKGAGELQSYSPTGGKIYFNVQELEEWIMSGKRATKRSVQKRVNQSLINKN